MEPNTTVTAPMHTPEPWVALEGDTFNPERKWGVSRYLTLEACQEIDGDEAVWPSRTEVIAEVFPTPEDEGKADAERIVACVNACAGIADPSAIPAALEALRSLLNCIRSDSLVESYADRDATRVDIATATAALAGVIPNWLDD